jgi:hypothetical protein
MIWVPLTLTALAAIHLGGALWRFSLDDWTLVFAGPIWGFVLLTAWGMYGVGKLIGG